MIHKVKSWMSKPVIVVDPDSSVSYAMTLMRRRNIHSLVVDIAKDNPAYGILTTTDIRDKIVASDRNPAETRVREIMSGPIITADPEWSLKECSRKMQERNIHHMPVANKDGVLIGIISATDIFIAVEESGWGEAKKEK
jgi:CBS domain-containing protein